MEKVCFYCSFYIDVDENGGICKPREDLTYIESDVKKDDYCDGHLWDLSKIGDEKLERP